MDFFTNTKPILISDKISESFNKMILDASSVNNGILYKIYENVIYPNLGVFIVILLILLFLLYRYFTYRKDPRNEITENFNVNDNTNSVGNKITIFDDYDSPNEKVARPIFNPSIPVSRQKSYVRYLPDEMNPNEINNPNNKTFEVPKNYKNEFQYTGPFYKMAENGLSDDMYKEFVSQNKQNMQDLDMEILQKSFVD